jgi:hypothetical protein
MDRRSLLAFMLSSPLVLETAKAAKPSLREAASDAWLYALPLIEMAGARSEALKLVAPNQMLAATALTTLTTQFVTTPNNDTLYARAWLDLATGPVTITLPPSGERYVSVALMDMYSNNFAILGTRTTGREGARVNLLGPQEAARVEGPALRSPTRWVWLLARTLVDGEPDLADAVAVQGKIQMAGKSAAVPPAQASRNAAWANYFASAQALIDENPPPVTDMAWLRRIEPLLAAQGIGRRFDARRFSAAEAAEIEAGVDQAKAQLRGRRQAPVVDGWMYPKSNLGDFGQDMLYRAQVAVGGLAALPPVEAMYMRALSPQGAVALDSARRWRLRFAKDRLPPVDAFWSLTMYELTPDGQAFFTANPLERYAIGDRTPGLVRGADGSLDIWIQREDPGPERRANWLPTPQGKPFTMILRAYLPKDELLQGSYRLPGLEVG